jgi:hypothetical protein
MLNSFGLLLLTCPSWAQAEWKPFTPQDGSFTVLFPAAPTEHKKSIKVADGTVEAVLFEVLVPASDGKFLVGYSEFPEASIKPGTEDKRLDNARDGAVAATKGTLMGQKILLLDGYPGRELDIKIDAKTKVKVRLYAVKNRLYQLVVLGNDDLVGSKESEKFLASFKLLK